MEILRTPFQGIWNIIRFNWHFYAFAVGLALLLAGLRWYIPALILLVPVAITLLASLYIYDLSGLYTLSWVEPGVPSTVVNIHAGFDETSVQLTRKFPGARLLVFDFYDPVKHTEVSVKRARSMYPPFPDTRRIDTDAIPLEDAGTDRIYVTFSAHEIRNDGERAAFFKQLNRILRPSGHIQVTEHLRDLPNFLIYNIGALHFLSRKTWRTTFTEAGLWIRRETKLNPFITTFILETYDSLA